MIRALLLAALLALAGCAGLPPVDQVGGDTSVSAPEIVAAAVVDDRPVYCATKACTSARDVEPIEGGPYDLMDWVTPTTPRLPWENAQAPPQTAQAILPFLGAHGTAVPIPDGYWPLQTTLVPTWSAGSGTPTFTRATTAYVEQYDGLLTQVLSGEARFQGARRVHNKLTRTDFGAGWIVAPGTLTTGIDDPWGGTTAATFTGSGADNDLYQSASTTTGNTIVSSVYLRRRSGTGAIFIFTVNGVGAVNVAASLNSTTYTRVSLGAGAASAGTVYLFVRTGTDGDQVDVAGPSLNDMTGGANQNPPEYVPALATANVDSNAIGVRYFDTLNGNTVASNVVTEVTGAKIVTGASGVAATAPVDAYGPFGYLAEGARTNLALQSQTFASWTGVQGGTITSNTTVAPDGTATADTLTANVGLVQVGVYQGGALLSATTQTHTVFAKAGTTPYVWININSGAAPEIFATKLFTLSGTGSLGETKVGTTSGTLVEAQITQLVNGFYKLTLVGSITGGAIRYIQVGLANAPTGNTFSSAGEVIFTATGAETAHFWQYDVVTASFASSPIVTTTVAVARNADVLTYVTSGNLSGTQGTAYAEVYKPFAGGSPRIIGDAAANGNGPLIISSDPQVRFYDGTNYNAGPAFTVGAMSKIASIWGGSTGRVANNGTLAAATDFDGNMSLGATISIGTEDGTNSLFGTIRGVRAWLQAISTTQLTVQTSDISDLLMPYRVAWLKPRRAANDDWFLRVANGG